MKRIGFVVVVLSLAAVACGDSDGGGGAEPAAAPVVAETTSAPTTVAPTTAAPTTTVAPSTTVSPTTTTVAPTTTAAPPPPIVPGEDADIDAIVEAYAVAFDSVSDYATKAPFIDNAEGLEETIAEYLAVGETFGGIGVAVTGVIVEGAEAQVFYDLLFNENPAYPDLSGSAVLTDEGWKVPRTVFCSLMASARVGCPQ